MPLLLLLFLVLSFIRVVAHNLSFPIPFLYPLLLTFVPPPPPRPLPPPPFHTAAVVSTQIKK